MELFWVLLIVIDLAFFWLVGDFYNDRYEK
jgi:hypothetical protein